LAEQNNAAFLWSIANLLRGTYKAADYGKVILPFTVLRRLDSALEGSKEAVLEAKKQKSTSGAALDFILQKASGYSFYNTSPYDLKKAAGDTTNLKANLIAYIEGFSPNVRDIFDKYDFASQLSKLDENDLLLLVTQKFSQIDLHPDQVSNIEMGMIFEELIRQFAELSNESAGDHFTPRDVVRLLVTLLFANDDEVLSKKGVVRTVYDPTAGTGGMLSVADDYIRHLNPEAALTLFGQELNGESYAIAKADMVIKGQTIENIVLGNTLTEDGHQGKLFDYCLSNPPFGVKWEQERAFVTAEHEQQGMLGRFGPGLPKVTDGALLFVLHLIKKMRPKDAGGGRAGIVLSASAFYNGDAGSGYSEIRKFLLMNDLVDAIVGLPDSMFYNTGIPTYLWILDNDKPAKRKGKVQLIDASERFERRRKSLGEKRKEITQKNIEKISKLYSGFDNSEESKVFKNSEFEYEIKKFEIPLRMRVKNLTKLKKDSDVILETLSLSGQFGSQLAQDVMSLALEARSTQSFIEDVRNLLKSKKIKASFNQVVVLLKPFFELDPDAAPIVDSKGKVIIDTSQTFTEKAPSSTDWDTYLSSSVLPVRPEAVLSVELPESGFEILWARIFARPRNSFDFKELGSRIATLRTHLLEVAERSENV